MMSFHRFMELTVLLLLLIRPTGGADNVIRIIELDLRKKDDPDSPTTLEQRQQQKKELLEKSLQHQSLSSLNIRKARRASARAKIKQGSKMKEDPIGFEVLSIADVMERAPVLQKFYKALEKAHLLEFIRVNGPFTLLIPWNKATVDADEWTKQIFANDEDDGWMPHLRELLLYHIHVGSIPLVVDSKEENDQTYTKQEILMANGLGLQMHRNRKQKIHFTDRRNPEKSFSQIGYHQANNGFGYMMETLFTPPRLTRSIDTALSEASFFYALLDRAGLTYLFQPNEDCHDGEAQVCSPYSNFTVFAPTNKAFSKVDKKNLVYLTSPEGVDALRDLLLYHIVPNKVFSSIYNIPAHQRPPHVEEREGSFTMSIHTTLETMLDGRKVKVVAMAQEARMYVKGLNEAPIRSYALARNGIVQILDKVLIPPPKETMESTAKAASDTKDANTCSSSSEDNEETMEPVRKPQATSVATSTPVPLQANPPSSIPGIQVLFERVREPLPPVPAPTVDYGPQPGSSDVPSLPAPTVNDIVNLPIVREGRKIKVVLP